jgi:N6-L-threonylcarbamoyladenine synthase
MTLVLGIESSCDETSASVVQDGRIVRSLITASQIEIHRRFGGVFPEVASRQHVLSIVPVVEDAMSNAGVSWDDLNAIAVTHGPGLAGSLLVGVNAAKGLAAARGLPLVAVNHLEAHLYANWLYEADETDPPLAPEPPVLCLIVSGGHSTLLHVPTLGEYRLLGQTIDDAAGEAFDKVARLLDLGYPGGPAIQRAAEGGSSTIYALPRAWLKGTQNFSFSGLKTAVLRLVQRQGGRGAPNSMREARRGTLHADVAERISVPDVAASFQAAVVDVLVEKTRRAAHELEVSEVLIAGGVAANQLLRQEMTRRLDLPVRFPPLRYCTDNAAMVASVGCFQYERGDLSGWEMDVIPSLGLATP